jgi:hypothetical protein
MDEIVTKVLGSARREITAEDARQRELDVRAAPLAGRICGTSLAPALGDACATVLCYVDPPL